ncbi:protein extra-macrochaetae-like [Strongylocentrotus purpuratus]|uniref:BHLH domain-containing protein n=1 Tax=Strongylocentrotus purpuratus TaxID=7668 RepID=A0A7M7NMV2_STRPU|nr:protein extra-macrochaetae-like [Strongylocentrotus purpuratus]|eukprot:XP_780755.1 PREDICTED: protein extra-macrochaetae [Strongylocentrotus purpuratus]
MKQPPQMQTAVQHQPYPAALHHTLPQHAGGEKKQKRAGVSNFTMSDCYEKLKQLVPTIPKNRKVTRVEILQHVIDYIQDLQTALEGKNIDVKMMGSVNALTGMITDSMAMPAPSPAASNRMPFTTIVPQSTQQQSHQQMTCPPATPLGVHTQSNVRQQQQQQCYPQPQHTSLFHHQGYSDYHQRQQMHMNMLQQHPGSSSKVLPHPYETPESSPESRPCSC